MKIKSVRIQNLRSPRDQTIGLSDYTCLVGANGAGKSTILCALNIFFRETENSATSLSHLDAEDFYQKDTSQPIEITVTFEALNEAAQADFKDYFRQGQLVITARANYDATAGHAVVVQYGNRLGMEAFAPYFERASDGAKASELKEIFLRLRGAHDGVKAATSMADMAAALREFETDHPDLCVLLPSEDQFYGVSQAVGRLRAYVQWVYIPAVKDAADEQAEAKNTAFSRLLSRTVRARVNFSEKMKGLRDAAEAQYREMVAAEQGALDEISAALQGRLAEWSHPEATAKLLWHQDTKTSIRLEEPSARLLAGDGEFEGQISRFGHGLQRSYIMALLQGLASNDDEQGPKLILGCEEPELYQHPPQARHLASVLQKLSDSNSQVIITTHSPFFIEGRGFDSVRLVRKDRAQRMSRVTSARLEDVSRRLAEVTGEPLLARDGILAKLHQVMQPMLNEMFFAPRIVLVEGLEDVAYINAWMVLTERWDTMRKHSCHLVPVNGKSEIIQPLIVADALGISAFVVFDGDGDKIAHVNPDTARSRRIVHERDNQALLALLGATGWAPFPTETYWHNRFVMWHTDLAKVAETEVGAERWSQSAEAASRLYGNAGGLKKNSLHVAARLDALHKGECRPACLERLCDSILEFCTAH
ncbi:AAA family ATPase [Methylobacterium sp. E-041]|uniref:ATP-dependent nuclease n=1 Tax=Methylobacterium sp. E-041 TaxID=2836573 RepID=UPI001FB89906|nr:AAA family ATPase [Methylobacterium sp. E-041]MCJ2105228.1 AAA family ATPase [Methylobacterium sp. E-041]